MAESARDRAEADPQGSLVNPCIPGLGNYVQAGNTTTKAAKRVRFSLGDERNMKDAQDANAIPDATAQSEPAPPTMNDTLQRPAPPARSMNPPQFVTPSPYMMSFLAPVPARPTPIQPSVTSRKSGSTRPKLARKSNRVSLDTDAGHKRKRTESPSDTSNEENEDLQDDTDMDSDTSYHAPVDKTNAEVRRRSTRSPSAEISYVESSDDEELEKILEEHESAEKTRRPRKAAPAEPVTHVTDEMDTAAAESENDDGVLACGDNDTNASPDYGLLTDVADQTTATHATANQTTVNDEPLEQQDNKLRYEDILRLSNVFMRPFLEQFAHAIMPLLKEDSRAEFEQVLQTANSVIPSKHDKDNATDAGSGTALQPLPLTTLQTAKAMSQHTSAVNIHVTLYVNNREITTRILSGRRMTTFMTAKKAIVDLFERDSNLDYAAIESLDVETCGRLADGGKEFRTVASDRAYAQWAQQLLRNLAGPGELEMRVYVNDANEDGNTAVGGGQNKDDGQEQQGGVDEGYRADDDDSSSESLAFKTA